MVHSERHEIQVRFQICIYKMNTEPFLPFLIHREIMVLSKQINPTYNKHIESNLPGKSFAINC